MAARIVCNRSGRSRAPPVSSGKRRSIRARSAAGGRSGIRAAASSIASGRPSSRWQISMIAAAFASVSAKPGCTICARSMKSATASDAATSSSVCNSSGSRQAERGYREQVLP